MSDEMDDEVTEEQVIDYEYYVIYESGTGKITREGTTLSTIEIIPDDGCEMLRSADKFFIDHDNHYVHEGEVTLRPIINVDDEYSIDADGEDSVTLDLPVLEELIVTCDGAQMEITESTLEIASDMPAEYTIVIECWPYVTKEVRIVAS